MDEPMTVTELSNLLGVIAHDVDTIAQLCPPDVCDKVLALTATLTGIVPAEAAPALKDVADTMKTLRDLGATGKLAGISSLCRKVQGMPLVLRFVAKHV